MSISTILINGAASDGSVPATDSSVLRGDGCFEVIRSYGTTPFRLDEHLERLGRSAGMLEIDLPPLEQIADWALASAGELPDSVVRIVATRGPNVPGVEGGPLVIVFAHAVVTPIGPARLWPVIAPWHGAGAEWELAGAKTISYGPNMAVTRTAQRQGFDDALLFTADGTLLEGPTFSVAWVVDGVIETPSLEVGILDSITRQVLFELADAGSIPITETIADVSRLGVATEVMALSTIREIQAVSAVGDQVWEPGTVTGQLASAFRSLVGD